ncbi:MAG TPA: polysaccharide deacetylase [Alphaproteobacteria bacterium]|nr:polysaccharide deacetylase [Alphaproteobacteria bacterium]
MIRNPIPWPHGARCAVAFTFDMDADSILHLAHHASAHTRIAALSMLRYGPEVAVPRIVELYRRFGMRQTFFLPAWCMERYPQAVDAILTDGHEIAHHGYLHEHPNSMPAKEERYWLERSSEVIVKMTGKKPRGIRAPTYKFSINTLDLLVEHGFEYDASLMGDDIPYVLSNGKGTVIEIPSHYGLDDFPHYMASRDLAYIMAIKAPRHALDVFRDEFDAAWEYGGLWVAVWHPFLSGRLARCRAIAELIAYMHGKGGVWFAPLEDIASHVRKMIADKRWAPRIDKLPYYEGPIPELGAVEPALAI